MTDSDHEHDANGDAEHGAEGAREPRMLMPFFQGWYRNFARDFWTRPAIAYAIVFIGIWVLMTFIHFAWTVHINGVDPYYHIHKAVWYRDNGVFHAPEGLTTTQNSMWRRTWGDKEWLYHVMLSAFMIGWEKDAKVGADGNKEHRHSRFVDFELEKLSDERYANGQPVRTWPFEGTDTLEKRGKFGAAFMATLLVFSVFVLMRKHGLPLVGVLLLLIAIGGDFWWYRVFMLRPHVFSITLMLWCWHFTVRNKLWSLVALGAIYTLAYTAAHAFLAVVVTVVVAKWTMGERFRGGMIAGALGGLLLGFGLHPGTYGYLHVWLIQTVPVLSKSIFRPVVDGLQKTGLIDLVPGFIRDYMTDSTQLNMGRELNPINTAELIGGLWTVWAPMPVLLWAALALRVKLRRVTLTLFCMCVCWGIMFCLSRRMVEYWAPFCVLFYMFAIADIWRAVKWQYQFTYRPWRTSLLLFPTLAILVTVSVIGGMKAKEVTVDNSKAQNQRSALLFLRDLVETRHDAGAIVFHSEWHDYVAACHYAPEYRYLVGLDPNFIYFDDKDVWQMWRDVVHEGKTHIYDPRFDTTHRFDEVIRNEFRAKYVLVDSGFGRFVGNLNAYPDRFSLLFEDKDENGQRRGYMVYEVLASGAGDPFPSIPPRGDDREPGS